MSDYDEDRRREQFLRSLLEDDARARLERALEGPSARSELLADPKAFLASAGLEVPDGIAIGSEERELLDRDRELMPPDLLERVRLARWICITFCYPRRGDVVYLERCVRFCFIG